MSAAPMFEVVVVIVKAPAVPPIVPVARRDVAPKSSRGLPEGGGRVNGRVIQCQRKLHARARLVEGGS